MNLGSLLISCLELYGHNLNYVTTGISVRGGGGPGCYYSKNRRGWMDFGRPFLLSMENPCDPGTDVGRNSWNIVRVRRAFAHAHSQLSRAIRTALAAAPVAGSQQRRPSPLAPSTAMPASILASVVRPDDMLWMRARELSPAEGAETSAAVTSAAAAPAHDVAAASSDGGGKGGGIARLHAAEAALGSAATAAATLVTTVTSAVYDAVARSPRSSCSVTSVAASSISASNDTSGNSLAPLQFTAADAEAAEVVRAKATALASLTATGVQLRHPGRLADIMTRKERKVQEMSDAILLAPRM